MYRLLLIATAFLCAGISYGGAAPLENSATSPATVCPGDSTDESISLLEAFGHDIDDSPTLRFIDLLVNVPSKKRLPLI